MRVSNASKQLAEQPTLTGAQSSPAPGGNLHHSENSHRDKLSLGRAMRLCLILALAAWVPVIGLIYLFFG
jgi:hypothetical protein